MVVRSIADISDLRLHIYQGTKRQDKHTAEVRYTGYRSTYTVLYILYSMVSVQKTNFLT